MTDVAEIARGLQARWRDMSSAPMDGTHILLSTSTNNPEDADYIESVCEGEHIEIVQLGHWAEGAWQLHMIGKPLAWAPIPDPIRTLAVRDYLKEQG